MSGRSLICLYPGVSLDKKQMVVGLGDTFKSPEIKEMRVLRFSHSKSKSCTFKLNRNNVMELLDIFLPWIYH